MRQKYLGHRCQARFKCGGNPLLSFWNYKVRSWRVAPDISTSSQRGAFTLQQRTSARRFDIVALYSVNAKRYRVRNSQKTDLNRNLDVGPTGQFVVVVIPKHFRYDLRIIPALPRIPVQAIVNTSPTSEFIGIVVPDKP